MILLNADEWRQVLPLVEGFLGLKAKGK
jgi:hypothetical protein